MKIIIQSFGYKKSGIPSNSNLVFDVRGLPNPHDVPELKELDGTHWKVSEWLSIFRATDEMSATMYAQIVTSARNHNKDVLYVSIGCYGGKHRSQYMVERMARQVSRLYDVETRHLES